jgi:ATP-dependent protease ClpP protease subunit
MKMTTMSTDAHGKSWFAIKSAADAYEIRIYDEIGADGIGADLFERAMSAIAANDKLTLRINSPGGDAFDAVAIYNSLIRHPGKVTAIIDGIAASAASLVAMAADEIRAPENAFICIQEPAALTIGTEKDHRATVAELNKLTQTFAGIYAKRSRQSDAVVRKVMADGELMTAPEAKAKHFLDVVEAPVKIAAMFDTAKLPAAHRDIVAGRFDESACALSLRLRSRRFVQASIRAELGIGRRSMTR